MVLELGSELDKFIDEHLNTFAHWDMVVLLFKKGELVEDSAGIASRVGRKEDEVKDVLEDLVKHNVAKRKVKNSGYLLNPNYKETVASFVEALKTREKRLMILTKVLEKGRS